MADETAMLNESYDSFELQVTETATLTTVDETAMLNKECDGVERHVSETATLIKEYDGIKRQLTPLIDYDGIQVQAIDGQVASVLHEINIRQTLLNQTQKADTHMQKRVHRNKNPRFLHYLVCNRAVKVECLKEELQQLETVVQTLLIKLSFDSAKLSRLQQQQKEAHAIMNKKLQMQGQSRQLFNQVVDCQPPTQTLKRLRAQEWKERSLLATEQIFLEAIGNSVQQVQQGLSLFQEAEYLFRRAESINERAKNVYADICDEAVGSDFGSDSSERSWLFGLAEERDLQRQHDKKKYQANGVAIQAFQIIEPGFSAFPFKARARFPQLCASIGQGDAILWHAGSFGTAKNDIRYDILGCQIEGNARVVGQCASMTSQQLKLMVAVQDAAAINVHQLQAGIQNLEQQIIDERNNIFNGMRSAVTASPAA